MSATSPPHTYDQLQSPAKHVIVLPVPSARHVLPRRKGGGGSKTSRFHRRSSRSDTPSDSCSVRTDTRSGAAQLALVFEAIPPFDLPRATRVLVRSTCRLQPARGTADGTVISTCAILQLLSPRSAALTVSPSCSPVLRQRPPVRVGRTRPAPGLTQSHDLFRHQSNFF